MTTANPYAAPTAADIGHSVTETYQPKVFSFSGRIGRLRYLAYGLLWNLAASLVVGLIAFAAYNAANLVVVVLAIFASVAIAMVPMFSLTVRRLNDLDNSGWWSLLYLVPLVSLALVIYVLFWPGTAGLNRFGAAPSANTPLVILGACIAAILTVASVLVWFFFAILY